MRKTAKNAYVTPACATGSMPLAGHAVVTTVTACRELVLYSAISVDPLTAVYGVPSGRARGEKAMSVLGLQAVGATATIANGAPAEAAAALPARASARGAAAATVACVP